MAVSKKVWLGLVVFAVVIAAYFGYSRVSAPAAAPTPPPQQEEESLDRIVWATGKVMPRRWATLSFNTSGLLKKI